jgi:hypothetical protein
MTNTTLIVAECRAGELLTALRHAVVGSPHWRPRAAELLRSIDDLELPEPAHAALIEIDDRKRAAEILEDVCNDD